MPKFSKEKRDEYLSALELLAEKKGGRCLSDTFINIRTPLKWVCARGHEWDATPLTIKNGGWCPICKREVMRLRLPESLINKLTVIAENEGITLNQLIEHILSTAVHWPVAVTSHVMQKRNNPPVNCEICGLTISNPRIRQKHCSDECRLESKRRKYQQKKQR